MKKNKTCCFIDYYSQDCFIELNHNNPDYIKLELKLKEILGSLVEDFSVNHFISGMKFGLEQISAEIILELKTKFSGVTLEGVIPYENYATDWTETQRDKYYSIMQNIDKEVMLQHNFSHDCMIKRNLYMINKSKYIILYTNNTSKINAINKYAKSIGKVVFIMDVETLNTIPNIKICR
ncbi:SLOG family protein [Sedimentibacter sp.]|uniref:SLOG family protein n=1 Tax=Sedimentibacter sp. TaxID=1960295 RepID=UPI0028A76E33|nr:SLOG family protein [Sedimentibacter sp.]